MPPLPTTNAPPEPGFIPRKEFIRDQKHAPNSYALLAIAGATFVRLYSFPLPLVNALRRAFEQQEVLSSFREDLTQNLCEFALEGKPWANPKAVASEKLLLDIFTIIYQFGYSYLSSIDYGREHDDRIALAFSKPGTNSLTSPSGTPIPPSPVPDWAGSLSSHSPKTRRIPFALSFASATVLRVLSPPLNSTPAILQAVRASWPRGVLSEKKIGDSAFEFKLKGYKWFQEDTFANDSLRYILSLLTALDSHSFSLLTSLSLTSRSRTKDLWIFTGPAPATTDDLHSDSPTSSIIHGEIIRRKMPNFDGPIPQSPLAAPPLTQTHHRKAATEPHISTVHTGPTHVKALSEDGPNRFHPISRKPAPKAQIPVSVLVQDASEEAGYHVTPPNTANDNMAGVGTYQDGPRTLSPDSMRDTDRRGAAQTPMFRTKTPPSMTPHSRSPSPPSSSPIGSSSLNHHTPQFTRTMTPPIDQPLLPSGVFRDSAFSSNTNIGEDVPGNWASMESKGKQPERDHASSPGPVLPGGWQPTTIEEQIEEDVITSETFVPPISSDLLKRPVQHLQDVQSRVSSPKVKSADAGMRKSEAGVVGVFHSSTPLAPIPERERGKGSGSGWVLVNVEGKNSVTSTYVEGNGSTPEIRTRSPSGSRSSPLKQVAGKSPMGKQTYSDPKAMSSAVKTIAIIDAVDAKGKGNVPNGNASGDPRRQNSLSRKHSGKGEVGHVARSNSQRQSSKEEKPSFLSRIAFRDRVKRMGTPEAPRNEERRRSLD